MTSRHVVDMARYSAFADERETVGYFLDFQEIGDSSSKTQKLASDRVS